MIARRHFFGAAAASMAAVQALHGELAAAAAEVAGSGSPALLQGFGARYFVRTA